LDIKYISEIDRYLQKKYPKIFTCETIVNDSKPPTHETLKYDEDLEVLDSKLRSLNTDEGLLKTKKYVNKNSNEMSTQKKLPKEEVLNISESRSRARSKVVTPEPRRRRTTTTTPCTRSIHGSSRLKEKGKQCTTLKSRSRSKSNNQKRLEFKISKQPQQHKHQVAKKLLKQPLTISQLAQELLPKMRLSKGFRLRLEGDRKKSADVCNISFVRENIYKSNSALPRRRVDLSSKRPKKKKIKSIDKSRNNKN